MKITTPIEENKTEFIWTEDKVIEFVNWYLTLNKIPFRYHLENQHIIDSFMRGDNPSVWNITSTPEPEEEILLSDLDGEILDENRYPTPEYLEYIEKYNPIKRGGYDELLNSLSETWMYKDWGFIRKRPIKEKFTLILHTGGWSGNEEIIGALQNNIYVWYYWKMKKAGGHYWFSLPTIKNKAFKS